MREIRGLILDMDGVLWRGKEPLLDIQKFFDQIQELGLKVVLATNNATKSVDQYLEKLSRYGISLQPQQIVNSAMSAAYYLKRRFPHGGPVFVVGEQGLIDTLQEAGFYPAEENVLAVVAGLDRTLNYPKLSQASLLIRKGALFVGTNPDKTFPSPQGLTPGAGAVLAFLETGSGVKPVITGKPEPYLFELALERMCLEPSHVLTVGDRLDTDILGAQRTGCQTAAVLTGVSSLEEIQAWNPPVDLILENLVDLIPFLRNG
ncbi:HAD-IIA family hydrolase [Anaerolinea thermophila]|uniref:Phosphatase n=1 Tax=Anaerolinea thermophila (strain DSM 14523 / JCM 11388 / NBRC 100420 / UNI-1) TaxID=926569 RepID=E8N5H4_ANATU|nr:HAD-IIA family hydrolase [Anaerolinea thermophila]BAJ63688.1 putative phosphatase [Anaerolinea thermophila UNI-1]